MTAVGETDLAIECLDLCQTLTSQGLVFKFSLTTGSNFSFNLDTRVLASGQPGQGQEETKPIHHQEECQAQGRVSEQEAKPCTCASCQASPASTLTDYFIRASPGDLSEEGWNNAILLTTGWQCDSLSSSWNDILCVHPQPIGRITLPHRHC